MDTLARGRLITGIALTLLAVYRSSDAAPPGAVTGQGARGEWLLTANVHLDADGSASGQLQVLVDARSSLCYWQTTDDDNIGDEDGIDDEFDSDQDAINALDFSRATYDFFYDDTFGRDSYDAEGNELELFIHARIVNSSGNVDPGADYFGRMCSNGEEGFEFSDGFVQDDVVTHEFPHGVVHYGSNLDQGNLPGALNESLADVFAFFHTNDPVMGENTPGASVCSGLPDGRGLRDVSNPVVQWIFGGSRAKEDVGSGTAARAVRDGLRLLQGHGARWNNPGRSRSTHDKSRPGHNGRGRGTGSVAKRRVPRKLQVVRWVRRGSSVCSAALAASANA